MDAGTSARRRIGSAAFWRVFAVINLVTVAWVIWVIWQLIPRTVVNDFVLRMPLPASHARSQRTAYGAIPAVRTPRSAAAAQDIPMQSGLPTTPLRLETEIKALPR